ncbi:hypothetical protein ARALYDRAFT_903586 [Arabidopsis lyrata subsp. lyrata]|uniref:Citrate synthase n=1 Tax=Arabidopsis lyrata subsp. lyrata TaxID=81972 RepID=D7LI46_ARALL|nr:hypothetical protein ARALYDRAFT_903586 [Arabidopsis lyrata subsp. lyrata]
MAVEMRRRKMSGFGHRVYKNYDPRAKIIKNLADKVFSIVGRDLLIETQVKERMVMDESKESDRLGQVLTSKCIKKMSTQQYLFCLNLKIDLEGFARVVEKMPQIVSLKSYYLDVKSYT